MLPSAVMTVIDVPCHCICSCTQVDNCKAFTYNLESSKCFLKEACLRLRKDRSANDISGVFLKDLRNEAPKNGSESRP